MSLRFCSNFVPCWLTTAHPEHALAAFERAAVDYLHKPVTPKRLALTVQRLQQRAHQKQPDVGLVKPELRFLQAWIGQSLKVVEVDQIAALRSESRYTRILTMGGESLLLHTSLSELLSGLDEDVFWQIHRGCIATARAFAACSPTNSLPAPVSAAQPEPRARCATAPPAR